MVVVMAKFESNAKMHIEVTRYICNYTLSEKLVYDVNIIFKHTISAKDGLARYSSSLLIYAANNCPSKSTFVSFYEISCNFYVHLKFYQFV